MLHIKRLLLCGLCLLLALSGAAAATSDQRPAVRLIDIRVTDKEGQPVSGLRVSIADADGSGFITGEDVNLCGSQQTDAAGHYKAGSYEAARSYRVTLENIYTRPALKKSYALKLPAGSAPYTLPLTWDKEQPQESLKKPGDKLILHVVDETGAPVPELYLSGGPDTYLASHHDKSAVGSGEQLGYCSPDGVSVIFPENAGSYHIRAEGGGQSYEFLVPYLGGRREYTLPLLPSSAQPAGTSTAQPLQDIAIRVVNAAGQPVPDVVVFASILRYPENIVRQGIPETLWARKADGNGIYRAQAASYAAYTLTATNNLCTPVYTQKHEMTVPFYGSRQLYTVVFDGEPPLTTLDKMTEKTVVYFTRPSGAAANGLAVEVRDSATGRLVSDGWTDYAGKYLLLDIPAARYELTATDEATGKSERYQIDTTDGGDLRFTLSWKLS